LTDASADAAPPGLARQAETRVSFGEFVLSLVLGILSVILPLVIFISMVAVCVYVARWWIDRPRT
jgi:hypothetical protein